MEASDTPLLSARLEMESNGRKIFERFAEPDVKALVDRWILEIVYGLTTIIAPNSPAEKLLPV